MRKSPGYRPAALRLWGYLNSALNDRQNFPEEPTYGYAFMVYAAVMAGKGKESVEDLYLTKYIEQQKCKRTFSWEFSCFALNKAHQYFPGDKLAAHCQYIAKGTRMLNWILLRQLNKVITNRATYITGIFIRLLLMIFQRRNGHIQDELCTRSLQYHAFCLFVLAELDASNKYPWISDKLRLGCRYASEMILDSGRALYIGRGQEQIFGYGSLLYTFEYVSAKYDPSFSVAADRVWRYVESFQRADGSFPLVLRKKQQEDSRVSFSSDHPPGWYGYNTLYDYLPFFLCCLLKADALVTEQNAQ